MASETNVRLVAHPGASQGFTATLAGVTVADLIQMKCLSGATESLRILSSGRLGILQFVKGTLTHAATANLLGDDAVLELLRWRTGDCEPSVAPAPAGSVVRRAWQSLLLSSAQAIDERVHERSGARTTSVVDLGGDTPTPVRSRGVSVRMNRDGQVLDSRGASEDLAAATAYALHMATYIGESLGLDAFCGAEFRAGELRTVVVIEGNGDVVALQSAADAALADAQVRLGL